MWGWGEGRPSLQSFDLNRVTIQQHFFRIEHVLAHCGANGHSTGMQKWRDSY